MFRSSDPLSVPLLILKHFSNTLYHEGPKMVKLLSLAVFPSLCFSFDGTALWKFFAVAAVCRNCSIIPSEFVISTKRSHIIVKSHIWSDISVKFRILNVPHNFQNSNGPTHGFRSVISSAETGVVFTGRNIRSHFHCVYKFHGESTAGKVVLESFLILTTATSSRVWPKKFHYNNPEAGWWCSYY